MKRSLFFSLALLFISFPIFANEDTESQIVYEKGKRNWFIEAGVNANVYLGQQDNQLYFLNRVGWGGSLNFGKWFTPCVGVKMELNASEYFGAALNNTKANFVHDHKYWNRSHSRFNFDDLQVQHFVAFNPNIDVMFSLFNSLGKVKERRVFDMILSIGGGVFVNNGANVDAEYNEDGRRILISPSFNIGLQPKFRLSKQVDLNIDLRAGWVSNSFDGQTMSGERYRVGDIITSAGISLTYKFKPRGYERVKDFSEEYNNCTIMYAQLKSQNDSLMNLNRSLNEKNRELQAEINNQQPVVKSTQIPEYKSNTKIIAILEYEIGVSELSSENRAKLKKVAEIIKANPEYTFEVCGYADNETGSKNINIRLRNARANRTIDQLLHYGVNRNQIFKSTNDGELPGTDTRAVVIRQLDCD